MTRRVYRHGTTIHVELKTPAGRVVCGCGRREWATFARAVEYCRECCGLKGLAGRVGEEEAG